MAFSRSTALQSRPSAAALTSDMAGIGMDFAADPNPEANVEDTLVCASELGMVDGDLRVLAVLTTWMGVHHAHVNADRLVRMVAGHPSGRVRAYWTAIASWLARDRRFARLANKCEGPAQDLLPVGTDFQIMRRGEDKRFIGSALRVPAGTLRDREADVLSPVALARQHAGWRNRLLMGPSWRADVWTVLERGPDLSVAQAARQVGCSFATAWQAAQDFRLLRQVGEEPGQDRIGAVGLAVDQEDGHAASAPPLEHDTSVMPQRTRAGAQSET